MDLVDFEALLIRAKLARRLVAQSELKGEEALLMIVAPSDELLKASLDLVEQTGVREDTTLLYGRSHDVPSQRRSTPYSTPGQVRGAIVRIDDLVNVMK